MDYIAINLTQLYRIRPEKSYTICTKMKFIYLHISGGGDLMKNFQKIGNEKRALRLLQFL